MNTTISKHITREEKASILEHLFTSFNIELDRAILTSTQDKISILAWILEEYQNRKWSVTHTQQVISRDVTMILGNSLYRDFILGLTQRVVSEWLTYSDDLLKRVVEWRSDCAAIFTVDKIVEEGFSLLNVEVFQTLQVNKEEYKLILSDNPWLLVYGLLLEYMHEWSEYGSYMVSVLETKKQAENQEG